MAAEGEAQVEGAQDESADQRTQLAADRTVLAR
jgi:uncharacterized membrane protein YidH (DUF202 family)